MEQERESDSKRVGKKWEEEMGGGKKGKEKGNGRYVRLVEIGIGKKREKKKWKKRKEETMIGRPRGKKVG